MAVAAERVAADIPCIVVEVLTADIAGISALAAHIDVRLAVMAL